MKPAETSKIMIYGARSVALGVCKAVRTIYPQKDILGFLVSSAENNPTELAGLPVLDFTEHLEWYLKSLQIKKDEIIVLVGAPETVHGEIIKNLEKYGFFRYICIDWQLEEYLMEKFFSMHGLFPSLHKQISGYEKNNTPQDRGIFCVFSVSSHNDCRLKTEYGRKAWIHTLQAGAGLTELRFADYTDDTGENISVRNGNYCELTALYWIWKNVLEVKAAPDGYYGLFQYRRLLHIEEADMEYIRNLQPEVILPFPTVHEPDIREHHTRYVKDTDWAAMWQVLEELYPDRLDTFRRIVRQPYMYNYNILIAKKEVLRDYCAWLFPVLELIEDRSIPKGREREDRYIGYLGECLLTLYFMSCTEQITVMHTGRIMVL